MLSSHLSLSWNARAPPRALSARQTVDAKKAKALSRSLATYPKGRQEDRSPQLDADVAAMRGDAGAMSSLVASSNLRRAAQTAVVALWESRLKPTGPGGETGGETEGYGEQVAVLSCLQEVSRNVDTLSLTGPGQAVPLQGVDRCLGLGGTGGSGGAPVVDPAALFAAGGNGGNKPVFGTGLMRLEAFCAWAFEQEAEVIICAGHSLWFKHFFNTYLPKDTGASSTLGSDAKDCKMKNGGCVAFTLEKAEGRALYRADPNITVVDGGFDDKKKRQKEAKAAKKTK